MAEVSSSGEATLDARVGVGVRVEGARGIGPCESGTSEDRFRSTKGFGERERAHESYHTLGYKKSNIL